MITSLLPLKHRFHSAVFFTVFYSGKPKGIGVGGGILLGFM